MRVMQYPAVKRQADLTISEICDIIDVKSEKRVRRDGWDRLFVRKGYRKGTDDV